MGLKHLKEQNLDLNFNLIDLLSEFDPTRTKKLTPLLVKNFKKSISDTFMFQEKIGINPQESFVINKLNEMDGFKKLLTSWIVNSFLGDKYLDEIPLFVDYLDRGLIENKDISTYMGLEDVIIEVGKASVKEMLKKSKKDILIVYEDDEWLFFKPLTHESSVTYGFGAKWCTSMKNDPEYFYRYSAQGVLIYVINKNTNRKFGIHSNNEVKIGIYDEMDLHIDSFETGLSVELIKKLFELLDVKTNKTNYELFSPEEKIKSHKYYFSIDKVEIQTEMDGLPMIEEPEPIFEQPVVSLQETEPVIRQRLIPPLMPRVDFRNNIMAVINRDTRDIDDLP